MAALAIIYALIAIAATITFAFTSNTVMLVMSIGFALVTIICVYLSVRDLNG